MADVMASMTPMAPEPAMPATRPTGVTILGALYGIGAAFLVLAGLLFFAMGSIIGNAFGSAFGPVGALIGGAIGIFFIIFGILLALVSWGFFTKQGWAWWLVLVIEGLSVLSGIFSLLSRNFSGILGLLIAGFLIWYLTSPGVQRWFGVSVKVPWHTSA